MRPCPTIPATARRAALAGAALFALAAAAAAEPLRVVTYNTQGMRPGSNWQVRLYFIVQRLIELDPDLVCLQEVCQTLDGGGEDNMARTIAEELGDHFGREYAWTFCPSHVAWDQFQEGVALVSRHPVLEDGCQPLPTGTFPRRVAWSRVATPAGELQVFSTHLEHDDAHADVRLAQARQARDLVLARLAAHPGAAVLGGDFNATPGSAPVQVFTAGGPDSLFADAWAGLHPGEPGYTMPSDAPARRIDYLLGIGGGDPWTPDSCRLEFTDPYDATHYMSDHLGLLAVYDLDEAGLAAPPPHPGACRLGAPWPNPFNPAVRLEVVLPAPASPRLSIHDLAGRELAVLHQGPLPAGRRTFSWHPGPAAAGLYLAVLREGSAVEMRRLLYLP